MGQTKILVENCLGSNKNFGRKIFWVKKMWVGHFSWSTKFGSKFFLREQNFGRNFFLAKFCFVRNKNLGPKNFGSKKFWVKKIGSKKLGQKNWVHKSSSWVKIGLHAENQLPGWSGSGLKVWRGWVVGYKPIIWSNQLELSWVLTKIPRASFWGETLP